MTDNPLVSIIVRTKDRPELLKRALQSIAAQDYRPIEVILVNDGGCDLDIEELKVILCDISLNYARLENNTGRAHAGNVGIEHSKGEYIGFLDDDDEFYPNHLSTAINFLKESDYKVVYTDAEIVYLSNVDEAEDSTETHSFPRESIDFSFETLLLQNYISFMSLVFHKTVLHETGRFDEDFDLCEDWDLIIRIGSKYPFYHIKKRTAKYTFWSEKHQVTIGDEKLAPYRLKILSAHLNKITPQVLYSLVYEGKWLGAITLSKKIESLGKRITELEEEITILRSDKENKSESVEETIADIATEEKMEEPVGYPIASSPDISVVLRVKNEGKTLGRVIGSILEQDYPGSVEIVVVDSGSADNTLEIANEHKCKIIKIKPEEFTFGKALNMGYQVAEGEIFVNLSGHSIPLDNQFLKNLVEPYEDSLVMATFGRNVSLPEACPSEARDLESWYPDQWIDVPERFSNGNASLRRSAWEKISFDERVSGSEDIIWAKQITKLGLKIVYVPVAAVYHSHSSLLRYSYERRLRETKALIENGQNYVMSFANFIKWSLNQTIADFSFTQKRKYGVKWYFHIPLYRFFQGYGIYAAAREKGHMKEVIYRQILSTKGKVLAYFQKSCRVIKYEGWRSFFFKVKRKIVTSGNRINVLLQNKKNTRSANIRPIKPKVPSPRKWRAIFIVDPVGFLTNHFRAQNMKEYLAQFGIESDIMLETELNYEQVLTFDVVVLCRVFMDPHIEKLVNMCRALRIPIIFDADDFIIDTSIIDSIASLENISDHEKELHREGIRKHRRSFEAADFFIAPTDYLANVGNNLGKTSFVIRNGFSTYQLDLCQKILCGDGYPRNSDNFIKIGYFSGTKTHQKDFLVVKQALLRIMEDFPHVRLYIGGHLNLDSEFEKFRDRTWRLPFVNIKELPYNIAKVDINIAPLEVNNPFCEAKSELKYSEAALLKIPTVASPTDAYMRAIKNGSNGFLATSADEWYECLKSLVEDSDLRKTMGQRAYEHVIKYYSPASMASSVRKTYERIISEYRYKIGISDHCLKISFAVPSPEKGSGGHNKIFAAAKYLSEVGHSVCLYFLNDGGFSRPEQLKEFVHINYFDPKCEIILGTDNISFCDILCATSWKTAYPVYENRDRAARLFYFVQDIESMFFPIGDDHIKCENTYRMGMHHITYGPWCAKILRERHEAQADSIPFSIDRKIYYPRGVKRGNPRKVIFFARPEMPRRCFWLGLEALWHFNQRNPSVKIILFGSDQIRNHSVPFPHENLGVVSKDRLAKLYSVADVGVAFSTTNPSLVPFEMMACGCPVVDFDYGGNYINYGSKENVKLAGISPEEVAEGIEQLISDEDMRYRIAMNGYQFVSNFHDDRESFRVMEDIFLRTFGIHKSAEVQEPKLIDISSPRHMT